ncbi:MAG: hypothetical protein HFE85_02585 [Clostridiales bacterium]|nr:hypothetical protein [Clostridiales bacterium]
MKRSKIIALLTVVVLLFTMTPVFTASAAEPQDGWNNAHWIWSSADDPTVPNTWMNFRRDFTLEEVPASAEVKIAVESKYWMYVNGEEVVFEGALKRGPNANDTYYDTVDIAEYLREGKNTVAIQVWYFGNTAGHHNSSGLPGLLFASSLKDSSNHDALMVSGDGQWKALKNPANYDRGKVGFKVWLAERGIGYDAAQDIDWTNPEYDSFEKDGWNTASIVGQDESDPGYAGDGPWNALWERPIPQWKDYGRTVAGYTVENGTYTIRLPYNAQMVPYLKLGGSTEAGKKISITTDTSGAASITFGDTVREIAEVVTYEYLTCAGEQEFEGKAWFNGDYLYFDIPEGVEVLELGYRETGYDVPAGETTDFTGYFDSVVDPSDSSVEAFTGGHTWTAQQADADNNFYDEAWKKAVRTLYVTLRDTYMDCPDRERGQYIGDAVNEMEEAFYSLGTSVNAISAKALKEIAGFMTEKEIDGRLYYQMSNICPGKNAQEIGSQSLATAMAARNYYLFTGDLETVKSCYETFYQYLSNWDIAETGEYAGLIERRPLNTYIDSGMAEWMDWGDNQDILPSANLWWYLSAQALRELADIEGIGATEEQKAWLDERLASIEANFEKFWNDDLQAYATEWNPSGWGSTSALENNTHLIDDRVQALAIVAGLVPEEKYERMRDIFMGTDFSPAYENASIYMEKYVLQALYLMGYDKEAMTRMNSRLMFMVNSSADSTLWEFWVLHSPIPKTRTKNHGWSGGSMIALSRQAAGVEPTQAGYAAWHVIPQMGSFTSINTRVPSEIGNIDVTLAKDIEADTFEMTVVSPGGNAEIWVPVTDAGMTVMQTAGGDTEYLGVKEAYQKQYAVYAVSEAGEYGFTAKSGCVLSATAPKEAQVNADFVVSVITDAAASDVRLYNENNMAIGCKAVDVIDNEDGTKTWNIAVAIGTVGTGRTLKVVTKGGGSYYQDSGVTVSLNITSVPPVLGSFDLPDTAVANRTFIVKATTDLAATKIAVYNEYGTKMGVKSLSYKIVDSQKVWTAVMSIGTKGDRTFTAYAVNKFGARSEALTDSISVKAFA